MASEKLELIATARDEASKVLTGLQTKLKAFGTARGGMLGGVATGLGSINLGAVAALGGVTALAGGIGEVAGKIGEAGAEMVNAAIEEEKNQARLKATLMANVPAWDGNIDAINRNISAMESSGYSADALRGALATLVTSTHNVGKSFDALGLAENIARGRGMDLQAATLLVAKTLAGNYTRAFKSAGLSLDGISNKEQALAFLTKTYAGQAALYADTLSGKLDVLQNRFHDTEVSMGEHLIKPTSKLADVMLNQGVPAVNKLADALGSLMDFGTGQASMAEGLGFLTLIPANIRALIPGMQAAVDDMAEKVKNESYQHFMAQEHGDPFGVTPALQMSEAAIRARANDIRAAMQAGVVEPTGKAMGEAKKKVTTEAKEIGIDVAGALRDSKDTVKNAMADLMYVMNHPLEREKEIAKIEAALVGKKLAAGLASTDPAVRAQAVATQQILEQNWANLTGVAYNKGAAILRQFAAGLASGRIPRISFNIGNLNPNAGIQHRASGGEVKAGIPYWVGENRRAELFIPRQNGYIAPTPALGGGSHSHAIYMDGRRVGQTMDERTGRDLALASSYSYVRG